MARRGTGRARARRSFAAVLATTTLALGALVACGNQGGSGGGGGLAGNAACDDYPAKEVRYIVPFSAGGGSAAWAESMKPVLAKKLGVDVKVEYLPGGGGIRGANEIRSAKPDGHTFGLMIINDVALADLLGHAQFDVTDLTMLARLTLDPQVFYAPASSDVDDIEELAAKSQREPIRHTGEEVSAIEVITYHIFGVKWKFILQEGKPETLLALRRGDADVSVGSLSSVLDALKDGQMKPILYEGPELSEDTPGFEYVENAPKVEDFGHPELATDLVQQRIMVAPPGLPECVETKLSQAMADTLQDPEFLELANKAGLNVDYADGKAVRDLLDKTLAVYDKYEDVLKAAIE